MTRLAPPALLPALRGPNGTVHRPGPSLDGIDDWTLCELGPLDPDRWTVTRLTPDARRCPRCWAGVR